MAALIRRDIFSVFRNRIVTSIVIVIFAKTVCHVKLLQVYGDCDYIGIRFKAL